jgi:hypothetical protein
LEIRNISRFSDSARDRVIIAEVPELVVDEAASHLQVSARAVRHGLELHQVVSRKLSRHGDSVKNEGIMLPIVLFGTM